MPDTTPPATHLRASTVVLLVWCLAALLLTWHGSQRVLLAMGSERAGTGWYGRETTPDGATTFRWTAPDATLTVPAGSAGRVIHRLRLVAAVPATTLRLRVDDGAAQAFAVGTGGFRTYQLLGDVRVAWGDSRTVALHTTPAVADGSRTLGVAIADYRTQPASALPGVLPPLWAFAVVASSLLCGWAVRRWGVGPAALCWLIGVAAWLAAAAGWVPYRALLLGSGGVLVLLAAALQQTRRLVAQALPVGRRLRRSLVLSPRLRYAGAALGLSGCAVIVVQMWPQASQDDVVGAILFSLILLGLPLLISLRTRLARLAPPLVWSVGMLATGALGYVFWRIYTRQIDGSMLSDLPLHMLDARRLVLGNVTVNYAVWVDGAVAYTTQSGNRWVSIPHPLFHWALGLVGFLMRDTVYWRALPVTLLLFQGLAVLLLYGLVRRMVGARLQAAWVWLAALSLHVVAAVYLPALNPFLYRGPGSVTIFHNATTIVAKPVSWLAAGLLLVVVAPRTQRRWLWALTAAVAVVVATLAKPNGTLALLPALWLVLGGAWLAGKPLPRGVWWLVVPSLAALLLLAYQSTIRSNGGSDFAVGWLRAALLSSPHPYVSVLQLCAFPLLTLLLAPPLWRDRLTLVVVAACALAVVQYFVFYEPAQITANNFAWGLRIVVPLWHALALGWLLRIYSRSHVPLRAHVLAAVYGLHLLAGALYLVQLLVRNSYL